jgi:hypothetical protein
MPRIALLLVGVLTLGSAAAGIAGYADLANAERQARFVCHDGERFSVAIHTDHVRFRSGTGIFTLMQTGDGQFQSPEIALRIDHDRSQLMRAGEPLKTCVQSQNAV